MSHSWRGSEDGWKKILTGAERGAAATEEDAFRTPCNPPQSDSFKALTADVQISFSTLKKLLEAFWPPACETQAGLELCLLAARVQLVLLEGRVTFRTSYTLGYTLLATTCLVVADHSV